MSYKPWELTAVTSDGMKCWILAADAITANVLIVDERGKIHQTQYNLLTIGDEYEPFEPLTSHQPPAAPRTRAERQVGDSSSRRGTRLK